MWLLGLAIGASVVLVVAALLIAILLIARNIERLAGQALSVADDIEAATRPVWVLGDANDIVEDLATAVRSIDTQVTVLASQLAPEAGGERP
jgi:hypothetical protein